MYVMINLSFIRSFRDTTAYDRNIDGGGGDTKQTILESKKILNTAVTS